MCHVPFRHQLLHNSCDSCEALSISAVLPVQLEPSLIQAQPVGIACCKPVEVLQLFASHWCVQGIRCGPSFLFWRSGTFLDRSRFGRFTVVPLRRSSWHSSSSKVPLRAPRVPTDGEPFPRPRSKKEWIRSYSFCVCAGQGVILYFFGFFWTTRIVSFGFWTLQARLTEALEYLRVTIT